MISIRWLDKFKLYEDNSGISSYVERAIRKLINISERAYCRHMSIDRIFNKKRPYADKVIISMTTFPARIDYVHLAIKSLLNQTIRPEKVILWLAKNQFSDVELPNSLKELCQYGLAIMYCEEDILAHKKYYYAMQKYPDRIIVTYDDDIIYPEDSLEKLLTMHAQYPNAIICNRGREICVNDNAIAPYRYWKVSGCVPAGSPSYSVMASTGAGTLYPAHCMPEETFNIEKIRLLALTADDLWMKFMSIRGQIPVVKAQTRCKGLCISKFKQNVTLAHRNVGQNINDRVIEDLLKFYPEVEQMLLDDVRRK